MQTPRFRLVDRNALFSTAELWLQAKEAQGVSQKTLRMYRETLQPFLAYLQQHNATELDSVTSTLIRQWLIDRRKQGISTHTLHNSYRVPKLFWNWCIREGLTDTDPFAKVEPPKREKVLKRALTPEEVQKLLKACEGKHWLHLRDRALILLLLDTGLRIHEAHSLRVLDILDSTCIVRGKGGKHRVIAFSPETRIALQRYLKACPCKPQAEQPLWWGDRGALTLEGMKVAVRKAGKRAGLTVGAHQLRRTFATWSLRQGIGLEHLRLLMGHSDLKVLQQYLALVEEDLQQAHERYSPLKMLRR